MFKIFHYRHIHVNFNLLWHWTSSTNKYILFFLYHIATANNTILLPLNQKEKNIKHKIPVAFIKHMQDQKKGLLVDISNFNKTNCLSLPSTLEGYSGEVKVFYQ